MNLRSGIAISALGIGLAALLANGPATRAVGWAMSPGAPHAV